MGAWGGGLAGACRRPSLVHETKVNEPAGAGRAREEKVGRLDISVDETLCVYVLESRAQRSHVPSDHVHVSTLNQLAELIALLEWKSDNTQPLRPNTFASDVSARYRSALL
eukprot:1184130-Prorocentrum_minimum.AAC.1